MRFTREGMILNLREDVWASLHLTPTLVKRKGGVCFVEVVDAHRGRYLIDGLDGHEIRLRYLAPGAAVLVELYAVSGLSGEAAEWQIHAVEPVIQAIETQRQALRSAA